jgi:GxxExxY protein
MLEKSVMQYQEQDLTRIIIGAAIEVHKALGPGLLESIYKYCLCVELENIGLRYKQEIAVPFVYKNRKIAFELRVDFLIEEKVVLELKSVETVLPVHKAQILSYLRLLNRNVGLLINFNVPVLKDGIHRCTRFPEVSSSLPWEE